MISIKKVATIGAAAAIFAATAVPAFAHSSSGQFNLAKIWNNVSASSNTGSNSIVGGEDGSTILTGNAGTLVGVSNVANKNVKVGSCGCGGSQTNIAKIGNKVSASSNTGGNTIVNGEDGSGIGTGDAGTAVVVSNVVNKNVSVALGED